MPKKPGQGGNLRVFYEVNSFDGGLNNKYEPTLLADNELADCRNVQLDDLGSVATRFGSVKINTAAANTNACDGLFTLRYNNSNQSMAAWFGGTMFALSGTTFATIASAQSVFTAGTKVDFVMYNNHGFFGNGGSIPYKYTGTNFTRHGVYAPNSAPTASGTSAGTLSGVYSYKITYVNSFSAESNPSSGTATITVANLVIGLTSLPVAPISFGVNSRKIYRTEDAGSTWKLVTTVADNTTTTYADNAKDATLGAAAPSTNDVPPNWGIVTTHKERLFVVDSVNNPQIVYYSNLAAPYHFPALNFLRLGTGDGEKITGLGVQGNALVVFKEASIWVVYMADTNDANWVVIKTNSKYGAGSQRVVIPYEGLLLFLGKRYDVISGFHSLLGSETVPSSTFLNIATIKADSQADKIEPDVFSFPITYVENAAGIEYKNKLYITVTFSGTTNNRIYVYDFRRRDEPVSRGAWIPWTGMNAAMFTIFNGDLYYGTASADGFVYKMEITDRYNDDGSAIDSYAKTKEFEGASGDANFEKDFRATNLIVETLGNWNMNFTHVLDSDTGTGTIQQINLNPGGSLWGTMILGVNNWGGGSTRKDVRLDLGKSSGKRIQYRFDNQNVTNQAFKVIRQNFYYNRKGLR